MVYVHTPAEHGAVPLWVAVPVTATLTVAGSPAAVPHAPLTVVTDEFVVYGNERAVPFTDVSATSGAVLSTVIVWAPLVPVLPAVSDCVTVTEYTPSADSAVVGVKVQALVVQAAVPLLSLIHI